MLLSNGTSVLWNLQQCSNVIWLKDLVFFVTAPGASAYLHCFALKKNGVWAILPKTVQSSLVVSTQAICIAPFYTGREKNLFSQSLWVTFSPPCFAWRTNTCNRTGENICKLPEAAQESNIFRLLITLVGFWENEEEFEKMPISSNYF